MGGKGRGSRTYVALMRGINVGGHNRLPMTDLVSIFEEAGCSGARSYIQSGNVLFHASATLARKLPEEVSRLIASRFGYQVPVVLREAAELEAIASDNPFLQAGYDPKKLHMMFLAERPSPARAAALDPDRFAPDAFHLRGRDIYLYFPQGTARSKLTTSYVGRAMNTVCTVRNWNTLGKIVDLSKQ
jgi:uncharacterized protein (DUF1697 family)